MKIPKLVLVFIIFCGSQLVKAQTLATFTYSGNIEQWTVPAGVTSIRIEVAGAQGGGTYSNIGGKGAIMIGDFSVTPGQVLDILVGEQPEKVTRSAGGGGGSFVVNNSTNIPLIIAGGGGGAIFYTINPCGQKDGLDATITADGVDGQIGTCSTNTPENGIGGVGGNGASMAYYAGGGGGFYTDGSNATYMPSGTTGIYASGGKSFLSGGAGSGGNSISYSGGGFGGGGAGRYSHPLPFAAGGGGGYSGGGGGDAWGAGGGGSSYNTGINQENRIGNRTNGYVIITEACTPYLSANITGVNFIDSTMPATFNGNPNGGTPPYVNHTWTQFGGTGAISVTNNNDGTATLNGTYPGQVELLYTVEDSNGCIYSTFINDLHIDCQAFGLTASITGAGSMNVGDVETYTANISGGIPPYTYSWYNADYISYGMSINDNGDGTADVTKGSHGIANLGINVTDNAGCTTTALISFVARFSTPGYSTPSLEWENTYGGSDEDRASDIEQTIDGGYVLAGSTSSNDFDVNTNTDDDRDAWIVKVNNIGVIEWESTYGNTSRSYHIYDIDQTSDEGFIISGMVYDFAASSSFQNYDGFVSKISSTGSVEWEKTYGGTGQDNLRSIEQTPNGDFIINGYTTSNDGDIGSYGGNGYDGTNRTWIVKIDNTGQIIWEQNFASFHGLFDSVNIICTSDSGYVFIRGPIYGSGATQPSAMLKLSSDGIIAWESDIFAGANSIRQTEDNGFVLIGNNNYYEVSVTKTDSLGQYEWGSNYNFTGTDDQSTDIQQTLDKGYILLGYTTDQITYLPSYWISKVDSLGNFLWGSVYGAGGSATDASSPPSRIINTQDNGYMIAGCIEYPNIDTDNVYGNGDMWAFKLSLSEDNCTRKRNLPLHSDPCNENGILADFSYLTASTQSHDASCGGDFPNTLIDAWYEITVPPSGNFLIRTETQNTIAPVIEAFVGECDNLVPVACQGLDTVSYAMIFENYTPGSKVTISVWDDGNMIANSGTSAILALTGHILSANLDDWEICDFDNYAVIGNPTNLAQKEVLTYILEFDENTPQDSIIVWENEALALGDTLNDECVCGGRTLQLWGVDNLTSLEERRKTTKTKAKVDTTNYNYIFEQVEFQVNDYSSGEQQQVDVAMDADGDFVMTWYDIQREHNYGRVYNSSGNPISSEFQIGSTNTKQTFTSIAMQPNGDFVTVWVDEDPNVSGLGNYIYGRQYMADGTPKGTVFDISLTAAYSINSAPDTLNKYAYGLEPDVVVDNNGNFIVLWHVEDNIFFQRFNNNALPTSSINIVNMEYGSGSTATVGYNSDTTPNAKIAINSIGEFAIVWNGTGNENDIYCRRYDNVGNAVGGAFKVNQFITNNQNNPDIAIKDDGTIIVVWESVNFAGSANYTEVVWRAFNSSNSSISGLDQSANLFAVEEQKQPSISLLGNGNFVISWSSYHEHSINSSHYNIYARIYKSDFSAHDPQEFLVNTITPENINVHQSFPRLASNKGSIFIDAWVDGDGDGNYEGIFAQRYEVLSSGGTITDYYPIGTATPSTLLGQELVYPQTPYTPPPSDAVQVRVAVIDTGIDDNHPLLSNALWQNQEVNDSDNCVDGDLIGYDFVNETGAPIDLPSDGHGTKVNGIVARDFDSNINLEMMNLKFHELQKGKVFDAVCAVYYAVDNGAEVMNLSWGFEASEMPSVLRDALLYASDNDVLIVTTAGNTSKNNDIIHKYPANLDIPNMIVVTSYTIDNQTGDIELSNYASYGAYSVHIAAHGFVETPIVGGSLDLSAGTSLAAPSVTRTAATIKGLFPTLTAADIKDCILSTAAVQPGLTGLVATNGCLDHNAALACAQVKNDMLCSIVDLYISTPQNIDSIYRSNEYIGSNATLSNNIDLEYLAADSILLDENFCVPLGAEFLADIEDCDPLNSFTGTENDAVFRIQEHSSDSGKVIAKFQAKAGENVNIRFMDSNKKSLDEWRIDIPKDGQFEKIINVHRLPVGLYYIEYTNGDWLVEKAIQIE